MKIAIISRLPEKPGGRRRFLPCHHQGRPHHRGRPGRGGHHHHQHLRIYRVRQDRSHREYPDGLPVQAAEPGPQGHRHRLPGRALQATDHQEIPEVDAVVGIGSNAALPAIVRRLCADGAGQTESYGPKSDMPLGGARVISTPRHYAYLKLPRAATTAATTAPSRLSAARCAAARSTTVWPRPAGWLARACGS